MIVQGEAGERFYVISDGEATVSVDGVQHARLGPGDSFGEIALLRDVPRTATVTAASELSLLALERDDFIAAVTGHAPSSEAAGAVVSSRLASARPALGRGKQAGEASAQRTRRKRGGRPRSGRPSQPRRLIESGGLDAERQAAGLMAAEMRIPTRGIAGSRPR